jgi:glycosyltransferase involved in cell wall biosynthesis
MLALAAALGERYRIVLVCPPTSEGLLARAAALGAMTLALEVRGASSARSALAAWLAALRIAVFHVHAGVGWEGHEGVRAARTAGVPVIVRTEHLPQVITDPNEWDEYHALISSVDRFICVSEDAQAGFLRAGVPPLKLSVVRNGIPHHVPQRHREAVRDALGLGARTRVVLTVGRLTEQKGHRTLCRAIPSIVEAEPDVKFLWAGDGPLEGELRALLRRLGVERYVTFLGQRGDVPDLLAAADLFVLPSLFEGLPLAVLEAMAVGLPVVATWIGGTGEAIEHGVTGHLVTPGDASGLAGAIADLLRHPARARAWGRAGRTRFEHEFHASRMARETSSIYNQLLDAVRVDQTTVGVAG